MTISIFLNNIEILREDALETGDLLLTGPNEPDTDENGALVFDGTGFIAVPALVDLHAHFREPGITEAEDIKTGSRAAAAGGYAFVNLMHDALPGVSAKDAYEYVSQRVRETGLVDAGYSAFIGRKQGNGIDDILPELTDEIHTILVERSTFLDGAQLLKAMHFCEETGRLLMMQAEDRSISGTMPEISEYTEAVRCCELAKRIGGRIHFTHVASPEAVEVIAAYREQGVRVSVDVTPHHLLLSDSDYPVNPPILSEGKRLHLVELLKNGAIDAIATDHAPLTEAQLQQGKTGIIGLETAFALLYENLVVSGILSLHRLVGLLSYQPAQIIGIPAEGIRNGTASAVLVFDPQAKTLLDTKELHSKSRNTPFDQKPMSGLPVMAVSRGKISFFNEAYQNRKRGI